jgi:hypothetical protein
MRALCAAVLAVILAGSCGNRFGVRDRYEGMKDGTLRVYARVGNPGDFDEREARKAFGSVLRQKGAERAALLIAASGIDRENAPFQGEIVFLRCNGEYCEAFIDYRIREPKKDGTRDK